MLSLGEEFHDTDGKPGFNLAERECRARRLDACREPKKIDLLNPLFLCNNSLP
jgi:hypothetical protein